MLTGSTTEAIFKGYVALLTEDPARSGHLYREKESKWRVAGRECSDAFYQGQFICKSMVFFRENTRLAGVCLPAASGTDRRCRVRLAKADVAARQRKYIHSKLIIAVHVY